MQLVRKGDGTVVYMECDHDLLAQLYFFTFPSARWARSCRQPRPTLGWSSSAAPSPAFVTQCGAARNRVCCPTAARPRRRLSRRNVCRQKPFQRASAPLACSFNTAMATATSVACKDAIWVAIITNSGNSRSSARPVMCRELHTKHFCKRPQGRQDGRRPIGACRARQGSQAAAV